MTTQFAVPPLRPFSEFATKTGKFELPEFQDVDRFASKTVNNLIYFQANYFIAMSVFIVPTLLFYMNDFALCVFSMGGAMALAKSLSATQPVIASLTHNHPMLFSVSIQSVAYLVVLYLGSVSVYMASIVIPMALVVLHASLRTRPGNTQSLEKTTAMRSPMGVILELLGETFENLNLFSG